MKATFNGLKMNKIDNLSHEKNLGCFDTLGWTNGARNCKDREGLGNNGCTEAGYTCETYGNRWCWGGGPNANNNWTLGSMNNFPEKHCCACGKSLGMIILAFI